MLYTNRSIGLPSPTPLCAEPNSGHSRISNTLIDSLLGVKDGSGDMQKRTSANKKNTTQIEAKPVQHVHFEPNLSVSNSTAKSEQSEVQPMLIATQQRTRYSQHCLWFTAVVFRYIM
ncbi:hypothetical protein OBBRIDRAFT_188733 [Obba rivulosa]|uniref:Uncharacterized protein n=1 Tax=Obba rivulosa TaxID=1052685 RepID=A0A8E2DGC3_9APHY|nr:hypothetical protein OBBRIDRAFT_188733 [Obba rivulosa]